MIQIRRALSQDEATWVNLMAELAALHECATTRENVTAGFRYAIQHPEKFLLFVAEDEAQLVGIVTLNIGHYSVWTNTWYGLVEDFIVASSQHRRGIGTMLLEAVLSEAQERKLSRLELYALQRNLPARKLYEKIGFGADSYYYQLYLK